LAGAKRLTRAADFAGLLAWRKGTLNALAVAAEITKYFLQGLKPNYGRRFTLGLKPQPPKEEPSCETKPKRVHSLPSRSRNWPQWLASTTFALQSRGGDGVAPSSRARSPRLMGRGRARCGLLMSEARGLRVEMDEKTSTYSKRALRAAGRRESSPRKAALEKPVRGFRAGAPLPAGQREDICRGASAQPGRRIRRRDSVRV